MRRSRLIAGRPVWNPYHGHKVSKLRDRAGGIVGTLTLRAGTWGRAATWVWQPAAQPGPLYRFDTRTDSHPRAVSRTLRYLRGEQ